MIEKPPGAAELNFAGDGTVLEISDHGGEEVVITGIQIVENHFGQRVFAIELVEVGAEGFRLRNVGDGIEAGIGAEGLQSAGVDVAKSAEVQLLGPAGLGIELAEEEHEVRSEIRVFLVGGGLAGADFIEDDGGAGFGAEIGVTVEQAVVGKTAARLMEEGVTIAEGVQKIRELADVHVGGGGETFDPGIEDGGEMDVESLIGTKRGVDARGEMGCRDLRMVLEIVGGIVGGAESADAKLREDSLHG